MLHRGQVNFWGASIYWQTTGPTSLFVWKEFVKTVIREETSILPSDIIATRMLIWISQNNRFTLSLYYLNVGPLFLYKKHFEQVMKTYMYLLFFMIEVTKQWIKKNLRMPCLIVAYNRHAVMHYCDRKLRFSMSLERFEPTMLVSLVLLTSITCTVWSTTSPCFRDTGTSFLLQININSENFCCVYETSCWYNTSQTLSLNDHLKWFSQ